jgi:8-oxo-dGTP diphosphatase
MIKLATTAVILHRENPSQFLIGRRQRDSRWELPGGKIDPGETPEQTVVREVGEELGIEVVLNYRIAELNGTYREIPMQVFGFETVWTKGEVQPLVHTGLKWIVADELSKYDIVEEDQEILKIWRKMREKAKASDEPKSGKR